MTAPKPDPALVYAEARRAEHQAEIDAIGIDISAVKGEMALLEDKLADMSRRLDRHVALRNLAQGVLDAANMPPIPETPPKPRAKPGEVERAVLDQIRFAEGDARIPFSAVVASAHEIAGNIGHSEDSVRAVIRRLLKTGAVRIEAGHYTTKAALPIGEAAE